SQTTNSLEIPPRPNMKRMCGVACRIRRCLVLKVREPRLKSPGLRDFGTSPCLPFQKPHPPLALPRARIHAVEVDASADAVTAVIERVPRNAVRAGCSRGVDECPDQTARHVIDTN